MMKEVRKEARSTQDDTQLSLRERECLAWTLGGKTAAEIARICKLSVTTVNHYASTATRKLNGTNKYHAAVKAFRLGVIS